MGDKKSALSTLKEIEAVDPINHFIVYEKLLLGVNNQMDVINAHRYEFPYQTVLELALFYYNRNNNTEAIQILEMGPKHLLNSLWLAYLKQNTNALKKLDDQPISFVFPFRNESLEMLDWVGSNSSSWKAKYFKGLNLLGRAQMDKGIEIFKTLGQVPEDPLFYYIRGLSLIHISEPTRPY